MLALSCWNLSLWAPSWLTRSSMLSLLPREETKLQARFTMLPTYFSDSIIAQSDVERSHWNCLHSVGHDHKFFSYEDSFQF